MIAIAASPTGAYSSLINSDISADLQSEPVKSVTLPSAAEDTGKADVEDRVTLSSSGLSRSRRGQVGEEKGASPPTGTPPSSSSSPAGKLTPEEQQAVLKLKQRDREVRTHEAAHLANAGRYATGGPTYTYQSGPDGKRYAIGGEVPIDVSKEKTPEQTIRKMETVRRAALAPANPSSADRNIAASASMKEAEARQEINSQHAAGEGDKQSVAAHQTGSRKGHNTATVEDSRATPQSQSRSQFQAIYA